MANTYSCLRYHIVFSTKHRERWIAPAIEERVWAYMAGIATQNDITPIHIGGVDDHVHLLLAAPTTYAPSKIAQLIKGGSSAWIHTEFPNLGRFSWQDGYGAFTVSASNVADVVEYIRSQRAHHTIMSYQDEYLRFLQKHDIAYDERYLWD